MAGRHSVEIELKYEVSARGAADGYLVAPELGPYLPAGQVRSNRIEDRYLDTADWALARAGYAARLRTGARGTMISLKATAAAGERLQKREEIEGPAEDDLRPREWPESAARDRLLELCGDRALDEIVTIRQLRRVRRLATQGEGDLRGTAELSLDEVEVVAGGRVLDTFDELEVELKAGTEAPLTALAAVLDGDGSLRHVSRSKLDRATAALRTALPELPEAVRRRWADAPADLPRREDGPGAAGGKRAAAEAASTAEPSPPEPREPSDGPPAGAAGAPPPTPKAGPRTLGLVADDSMPEAARRVLEFHFARMQKREAGAREGLDTEELHDMRVAVRRMRAAWRVFDGAFRNRLTRRLRRRLRTLSDRLGAVRDLDVLIETLDAYCSGLDPEQRPGLESLLELWRRQRDAARRQLIDELDSPGYATLLREMDEFLSAGVNSAAAVGVPTSPHRVRDRAPSLIWGSYEAVRAYELVLPWADIETLHQLRIAVKWLRYTLEFFGETLGRDGPNLLARVVALQDFLGCLHDADVAAKLARDVLVAQAGELTRVEVEAIGSYLHSREREVARRRRALGPVWRAVNGAPFRRALGRATAAL